MRRGSLCVLVVLLLSAGPPAAAGTPITIGESVRIGSKILGEERTLFVSVPEGYTRGRTHYPVLYLTDAEAQFQEVRATADFLRRNGFMPPVIVVGVANTDRTRDLTPTHADWKDAAGELRRFPTSGGAGRFLDFFEKELVPWVEANYGTEPFRIFCGHSFGGLFAVHAFLDRPGLFQAVIAASPTLWWDDNLEIKRAEAFLAGRKALKRTFFMTIGSEGREMQAGFDALRKVLQTSHVEGFRWATASFPDEDHGSVVLRSHYAGLKMIFDGWHIPRNFGSGDLQAGTLADLKKRFAAVSEQVGFAFSPPEALVNRLGRQALGRLEVDSALEFFRYNAATYPGSASAHEGLGEALEKQGRLADALESYSKARELGEKDADPNTGRYARNVERVRERLAGSKPTP